MQQRQFDIRESQPEQGINYAIPLDWWKLYCSCRKAHGQHANKYGSLGRFDPRLICDSLVMDCEEYYLEELAEKSTYMNLTRRLISPQLLPECRLDLHYQLVNHRFYESLEASLKPCTLIINEAFPIIVFALKEKEYKVAAEERVERANGLVVPMADRLVQLILCTNRSSSLVICHVPRNVEVAWVLDQILKMRKMAAAPESRIVFIDDNKEASMPLQVIEGKLVRNLKDTETVIMLINLLSIEEEPKQPKSQQVGYEDFLGSEPDQPNNSDNKTESTGASTLLEISHELSFRHEHQHMMEIIREKTPEQIEEMKLMAKAAIESAELILVRECSQLQAQEELAVLADKIMEIASTAHKKKFKELKEK